MAGKKDELQCGQDAFMRAVDRDVMGYVNSLPDLERERWWSGFIISAISACGLSVGSEMASMIAGAAIELENEVHAEGTK